MVKINFEEVEDSNEDMNMLKPLNLIVGCVPFKESILPTYSYSIDFFKGRSFKVGWTKGFTFTTSSISNYSLNPNGARQIKLLALLSTSKTNDGFGNTLHQYLNAVFQNCIITEENSVPVCKIVQGKNLLMDLAAVPLEFESNLYGRYYKSIWQLLIVFWGKGSHKKNTKSNLSEWLENVTNSNVQNDLLMDLWTSDCSMHNILAYLSGHRVQEAAHVALKSDMPQISLLLSQVNSTNYAKSVLEKQLYEWMKSSTVEYVYKETFRCYMILAGIPCIQNFNVCESLDWLRTFGMFLWYISPASKPIRYALQLYQNAFKTYAKEPLPPYSSTYCKSFDIIYYIILLHTNRKIPIEEIIIPRTHTKDMMDYRLSWLLLQCFLTLQIGVIENETCDYIHVSFASQLESLGLYKWAIFVLLFLRDADLKRSLIMGVLHRNICVEDVSAPIECEMISAFKIPLAWTENIKGIRLVEEQRYWTASKHFSNAGNWKKFHEIALKHILPDLILNKQYHEVSSILNTVLGYASDIPTWTNEGGLILDFLKIRQRFLLYKYHNFKPIEKAKYILEELQNLMSRYLEFPSNEMEYTVCINQISESSIKMVRELSRLTSPASSDIMKFHFEELVMPYDSKMEEYLACLNNYGREKCKHLRMKL